jgi:hypothetical protein
VALIYVVSLVIAVAVALDLRRLNVDAWALYALVVFLFPLVGVIAWTTARNKRIYGADRDETRSKRAFPL